ncbi:PfaD family polyunsaturated fatty acid/polyketide biosynthesis protein [Nocardia crassostreae]|uniref:PfaD family polyunsaturated fatty acid/polyketide biosynthesis protein n=1 Tax=Nocardia crassostreae TaxID=53428 RepID=UPI000832B07E|nr:PfaD family polyunsaturated fatty acid/polyketide biosynthesis protein [Nocardia crassostreae]
MVSTVPAQLSDDVRIVRDALLRLDDPFFLVRSESGVAATNDPVVARAARVLTAVPPIRPESLGDAAFRRAHGVRLAYMAGAMANGIASARMVIALARTGVLASFGAAGVLPARVDEALSEIRRAAPGMPFACNLIHSPNDLAMERATVDLCLRHQVRCIEASAFMSLTPQVVHYRLAGLAVRDGRVVAENKVIAKVSRTEVAELFLRPAPEPMVRDLVSAGLVTQEQADLSRRIPMADDITAEVDSGGHTDRRPLTVLLPELIALRDRIQHELGYAGPVRIGAAGGIGTPTAAHAAFALGAAYVVTGSINQASVEAAQSDSTKQLLVTASSTDCAMAPSADMFEMGVEVQVLKRGTLFAARAKQLYDTYRAHPGIDAIPAADRAHLEQRTFQRPLDDIWSNCVTYFTDRDPDQIARAESDPKRKMALIFRWYLGLSSAWSITGDPDRIPDYQVWCGPAMGAFNTWAAGSYLAPAPNRHAADLASHLMRGTALAARVTQLRSTGARLPSAACTYIPTPLER